MVLKETAFSCVCILVVDDGLSRFIVNSFIAFVYFFRKTNPDNEFFFSRCLTPFTLDIFLDSMIDIFFHLQFDV